MPRTLLIVGICALTALVPVPAAPALSPYVSLAAGGSLTAEAGYGAAAGLSAQAALGLAMGDDWGALVQGGAAYHSASAFTAEWYRYRGFLGFMLGAGPRLRLGVFDAYLLAGGQVSRYDSSCSYFFFPFVEAGASLPVLSIGRLFELSAGAAVPVLLRADAFGLGLRAFATLAFKPASQPAAPEAP